MRQTLFIALALFALPVLAAEPASPETLAELDALYANRGAGAGDKAFLEAISAAVKAHPEDYEVLWRASRFKWWVADGATDAKMKERRGKEGWELAERAVAANPKGAAGHYYAACGIGAYSQAVGILNALTQGLEGKFNERLDRSIALDAALERSGGYIAKGRYFYELPWPKRDLGKSAELLKKAQAKSPENLRASLYLAETYLKDGEPKKAQAEVAKISAASVAFDPPEGRRIKQWAKQLSVQIEEELK